MSSWAFVASQTVKSSKLCSQLVVKYNSSESVENTSDPTVNDIPRHRELTPHPADDFIMTNGSLLSSIHQTTSKNDDSDHYEAPSWIDYTNNKSLRSFKESLPISVQRIIEFANNWKAHQLVINLDFNEIDQNLHHLYQKYNGNKNQLKSIFFNFYPELNHDWEYGVEETHHKTSDYDERYIQLLGKNSFTVVHYLFNQIFDIFGYDCFSMVRCYPDYEAISLDYETDIDENEPEQDIIKKSEIIKQMMRMLKLMIMHNIIDVNDVIFRPHLDDRIDSNAVDESIWDKIKYLLYTLNKQYSKYITDDLADLIMAGINQRGSFDEQDAVLKYYIATTEYDKKCPYFQPAEVEHYCTNLKFWDSGCNYISSFRAKQLNNEMIDALLFRGMLPFQFVEKFEMNDADSKRTEKIIIKQPVDGLSNFIENLLETEKVFEPIPEKTDDFDNRSEQILLRRMSLLAPLIMYPNLDRAKNMMIDILSQCVFDNDYIKNEHLSKEISNVVTDYLYINLDEFYDKKIEDDLNAKSLVFLNKLFHLESTSIFINDFKENYCDAEFLRHFTGNKIYVSTVCKFIAKNKPLNLSFLITFINQYDATFGDFPLVNEDYGIYTILEWMMQGYGTTQIIQNPNTFIEFLRFIKWYYGDEFDINHKFKFSWYTIACEILRYECHVEQYTEQAVQIIKCILTEFKNPEVMYYVLSYQHLKVFEMIMKEYEDMYSLTNISELMIEVIEELINEKDACYHVHNWTKHKVDKSRAFLKSVESLVLNIKCKNDQDTELWKKSIIEAWNCYSKILKKKHWYW